MACLALCGCADPPGGFESPVPAQRLRAVADAAEDRDRESIPELIRLLESDDPLVRMASIRTLERITGQTLGYEHSAPEHRRAETVRAWVEWYQGQSSAAQGPGSP
jgi:HEAT repeat protein